VGSRGVAQCEDFSADFAIESKREKMLLNRRRRGSEIGPRLPEQQKRRRTRAEASASSRTRSYSARTAGDSWLVTSWAPDPIIDRQRLKVVIPGFRKGPPNDTGPVLAMGGSIREDRASPAHRHARQAPRQRSTRDGGLRLRGLALTMDSAPLRQAKFCETPNVLVCRMGCRSGMEPLHRRLTSGRVDEGLPVDTDRPVPGAILVPRQR